MASAPEQWHRNEPSLVSAEARLGVSQPSTDNLADYERYLSLVRRTVSVFGDEITASRWLSTPSPDFNGETPIEVAQKTGYTLMQLEPVFVRIEHGIDF